MSNSETGNRNYHSEGKSVFDERYSEEQFVAYRRQWRENPETGTVAPFPLHLDIETTNACNLNCRHCAASVDNWGNSKRGFITLELFQRILQEAAAGGVFCIKFSMRGEPLLHPGLIQMLEMTGRAGILDFYFNTNAMLLDETMARELVKTGVPRISISIDGWDAESFEAVRSGAKYQTVCSNTKQLQAIRDQMKVSNPRIRVQAVLTEEFKLHWSEYQNTWEKVADEVGYLDRRSEGIDTDHRGRKSGAFICPFLWQRMSILWDGTVLPCLAHGVRDFSSLCLGNAASDSIKALWKSDVLEEMRRLHRIGRSHEIEACDQCSYRAAEIEKLEKIKELS
jgi:MoaA/NifB/PqqE/SkfB family radical SAM enzyme